MEVKAKIEKTDWLIDQVVYHLYGLSEEEIEAVEGSVLAVINMMIRWSVIFRGNNSSYFWVIERVP